MLAGGSFHRAFDDVEGRLARRTDGRAGRLSEGLAGDNEHAGSEEQRDDQLHGGPRCLAAR